MAKFGNMVRTDYLSFTDEEVCAMQVHFINLAKEVFGNDFTLAKSDKEVTYTDAGKRVEILTLHFMCEKKLGRNCYRDRFEISGFSFDIFKGKGYLRITDYSKPADERIECDYENAPSFQYSSLMNVDGSFIRYRCRKSECLYVMNMYKYGTEVSDLNYIDTFNELKKAITIKVK